MKNSIPARVALLLTLVAGLFMAPALADKNAATASKTVVYFGAPW